MFNTVRSQYNSMCALLDVCDCAAIANNIIPAEYRIYVVRNNPDNYPVHTGPEWGAICYTLQDAKDMCRQVLHSRFVFRYDVYHVSCIDGRDADLLHSLLFLSKSDMQCHLEHITTDGISEMLEDTIIQN